MHTLPALLTTFTERATATGGTVLQAHTPEDLLRHLLAACMDKAPCEKLMPDASPSGPLSPNGVPTRTERVLAAPRLGSGLPERLAEALSDALAARCAAQGVRLLTSGLRDWTGGFDAGVNTALAGIADSGTCLVDTADEDLRLAGMLAETGVILLPASAIVPSLTEAAPLLRRLLAEPGFVSCITGPSRTADIERVPAVGVHGPLALHIILLCGELDHA